MSCRTRESERTRFCKTSPIKQRNSQSEKKAETHLCIVSTKRTRCRESERYERRFLYLLFRWRGRVPLISFLRTGTEIKSGTVTKEDDLTSVRQLLSCLPSSIRYSKGDFHSYTWRGRAAKQTSPLTTISPQIRLSSNRTSQIKVRKECLLLGIALVYWSESETLIRALILLQLGDIESYRLHKLIHPEALKAGITSGMPST